MQRPVAIVGLGASAGGVDALQKLFAALPAKSGLAFVIISHLSPDHESMLSEVIGRYTAMPVQGADDGAPLRSDNVYVLRSNTVIGVEKARLRVTRLPTAQRERTPIDIFFGALAKDQGERAIGIVLSGGGTDGTLGIKAIKEYGGFTFAQVADGSSLRHSAMPDSAIATGVVDFAVPVEQMPDRLLELAKVLEPGSASYPDVPIDDEQTAAQLRISEILNAHGQIAWSWTLDGGSPPNVVAEWRESNGPESETPEKHGFGLTLVEREIEYGLKGRAEIEFGKAGLVVKLRFPLTKEDEK
jgi:hypothetical protein